MDELIYASATRLAQMIRDNEVSSEEVIEAYLQRIAAVNPRINAVVQVAADAARAQAREADAALARGEIKGPLHGVPMTVKDAWDTAGLVSTGGTKGRAAFIAAEDATVIRRMRDAGAIVLGMTNVPEMSLAFESDNLIYGRTNNPYDLARTPGGSGGGGAAAIAAGASPIEIGADAAGSVRLPSHFSGIAGIKPTKGRVPLTGYFPPPFGLIASVATAGPMARRVEDLVLTLPIVAGVDGHDPSLVPVPLGDPRRVDLKRLRAAFHTDNGVAAPTRETAEVIKAAARSLANAGLAVEEARPAGLEQSYDIIMGLFAADGGAGVQMVLDMAGTKETHPLMERYLKGMRKRGVSGAEFASLVAQRDMCCSRMLAFWNSYDVIICPVNASPAMLHGTTWDKENAPAFSYTMTHNLTGWPGAVVRGGGSSEGLPIGVQIVAPPWREDVALAVAGQIEADLGGWQRPEL
jgi:amidase